MNEIERRKTKKQPFLFFLFVGHVKLRGRQREICCRRCSVVLSFKVSMRSEILSTIGFSSRQLEMTDRAYNVFTNDFKNFCYHHQFDNFLSDIRRLSCQLFVVGRWNNTRTTLSIFFLSDLSPSRRPQSTWIDFVSHLFFFIGFTNETHGRDTKRKHRRRWGKSKNRITLNTYQWNLTCKIFAMCWFFSPRKETESF